MAQARITKRVAMLRTVVVAAAVGAAACVDMSAPPGPASISVLQLPALFVVRGDVMRDSLGNAAMPAITAYDAGGATIAGLTPDFFVTDSNAVAHFANGVLTGDRLGTVHVLGQIGNLQTAPASIFVTVAPTHVVRTAAPDTLRAPVGSDSATSLGSTQVRATVRGVGDTAVAGMFVRFAIIKSLESSNTSPAVYLADDAGNPSVVDTTDVSGIASRRVVVISRFLNDAPLLRGERSDSVVVEARTTYRGAELTGGPIRFSVPVKVTFALP